MLAALKGALADLRAALRSDTAPSPGQSEPEATAAGESAKTLTPPAAIATTDTHPTESAIDAPETVPISPTGATKRQRFVRVPAWLLPTLAAGCLALVVILFRYQPWTTLAPADPDVVATYQNGTVTRDQLKRQLDALPAAQRAMSYTPEGLKALVGDTVAHEVTRRWAEERQVDQQQSFKEAMKHATEQIQLADIADQLHQGRIQVGEAEIQAYYDQNRARFGERPLAEVRDQIRSEVVEQKEGGFVQQYLKDLRERASLQVDYTLLDVPQPAESELLAAYQARSERFRVPEQVKVAQIRLDMSHDGGHDMTQSQAEAVRARAAAGEDFSQLAQEVSDGPEKAQGGVLEQPVARGTRGQEFDDAVSSLRVGEISPVFMAGDTHLIVKLLERTPERVRPYAEVRDEIGASVRAERELQIYGERRDRTLFTIHGRRTTLGEFVKELDELPQPERAQYDGPTGKRRLLDSLIERLLVVEDATEQASDVKRQDEIGHARLDLLGRLLHQEQVDDQAKVSDEAVRAEFDSNQAHYADPPRVKVRYLRVRRGRTTELDQQARSKVEEAERKVKGTPGLLGLGGGEPAADFGEVAKQYSEDAQTAANGGLLDRWLGESDDQASEMIEHTLHQELLPRRVGEVSPIVTLGDSYFLFQIDQKEEARQRSFDEARDLIRRELEERKHEELARGMQRQLLERMQLQVYDARLQQLAAELAPATPGAR